MEELTTSLQQVSALQAGRIDIGVGRIRSADESVERIVLGDEKLVLAAAPDHALAASKAAISLTELGGQSLIVYPQEPRPSFADYVISMLRRSEEHTSELQSLMRISYAVFCLK